MLTRISKTGVVLGGLLVVLSITGCGTCLMWTRPEARKSFTITGVEYDEAFSKGMKAAMEIGLDVYGADKNTGVFRGYKMTALGYISAEGLTFFLEKGPQGKLSVMIKAESSRGSESVINEFVAAYGKYVKVSR